MDKKNNTRPYDDLNTLISDDTEDTEMEEGEAGEGEGESSTQPPPRRSRPPRVPIPNNVASMFNNMNNNNNPSNIFANLGMPNLNTNELQPPIGVGPVQPPGMRPPRDDTNSKQFDFRHSKMPEGVTVIGEGEMEVQQDKSTALSLGPKSCLSLNLGFKLPAGDHKFVNNYTITMDIKVDSLPNDSLSLYQANLITRPSEGECYISKTGGVGIFGEYGVRESWVKEKKWTRVVITLGGHFGGEYRRMTTYVNGKVCASINKGVLQSPDGRFGLSPECLLLFGSINETYMPGIRVRYVDVRQRCLSTEEVREMTYLNRVYSFWEAEEEQAQKRVFENMSLQPLYKRPPPVWLSPAFLGEFGDAFLEGTGLEGGSIPPVIAAYSLALDGALQDLKSYLNGFEHDDFQHLDAINEIFKDAKSLARQWGLVLQNGAQQLPHYLRKLSKLLVALKEGEFMLVPGGIGPASLMYIVERITADTCRFVVVNTDPHSGLEFHESHAQRPGKLMYKTCLAIDDIPLPKVLDDALWACLLKLQVYGSKQNTPDKVYDLLLPFLGQKPLEAAMEESSIDPTIDWRSPQRAGMAYFRVILESFHYLMRRKGISPEKAKQMTFVMRLQFISMAHNDLRFVRSVTGSDVRLIRMACEQLAYTSLKISNHATPAAAKLTDAQLVEIKKKVDDIDAEVTQLPNDDSNSTDPPPPIDLEDGNRFDYQHSLHPFFDRLVREEDVDGLAGAPIRLPKYVPVDVLQIPARVTNFEEALAAIRYCDKMCTLISVQAHTIKNINFLKVSLIEHTFVHVVPTPKGQNSPVLNECVWQTPIRYALQLDILILLQRIIEHFAAAAFALQATRSFDAVKIIVPSVIACIADVVMRKKATDIPSEVSLVLMGYERAHAYGLSTGKFGDQSETIEVHTSELNIARTSVLDYFADQRDDILPSNQIFCWENGNIPEESTARFLSEACEVLAFDQNQIAAYVSGEQHLIIKNYPEFKCYRDVSYYFKYFMNTETEAFPPIVEWTQKEAQLSWRLGESGYEVFGFGNMPLFCRPRKKPFTHRFPSTATPSFLTDPHPVRTEDDVLHIKNLPNFEDALGQRDSELLISYLTVPYLRLPLVLTFFSTEDRIHSLKSKKLRDVFDSVLFEPGRYLPAYMKDEPKDVPTTNPILLATPYGHLINELHRSPSGVIESMLKLITLALDLDSGTVKASTLASRFENYLAFMIDYANKRHASITGPLRDVTITPNVLAVLEDGISKLRTILYGPVHRLLEEWVLEAMRETEAKNDEKVLDENTKLACTLYAHLLMLYRNTRFENLNEDIVSTLLSGFIFLTTRHTWNMELLELPETEMFELLAVQRRNLINWLRQCGQLPLNVIMESIMRVTTGTGIRKSQADDALRKWGFISGDRSVGRFTMLSSDHKSGSVDGPVQMVSNEAELGVEIDIQTVQLTLKSSHLKALDRAIAADEDVVAVFGKHSMQAATIQSTEHREWVRLIGRDHDLQFWKTPDKRTDVQILDRDYVPGELEESENWIIPIFEPVRLSYLVQPFELQICLPENPIPTTADVAMMIGIHPKLGGTWKEIFVYKSRRSVQIYHVLSHGRRFYRCLEYTNDTRITLRDMQPVVDDRNHPWPKWERHGCGHPYNQHPNLLSVIITRDAAHTQNISDSQETFIPSRLLHGIVPSALLDTHMFWQDKADNLRGYPTDDSAHIIYIELQKPPKLQSTQLPGVSARIRRIPKLAESGRESLKGSRQGNPKKRTIDQEELVLVDLLHAPVGSKLHSVASIITRLERLSYVLAWTRESDPNKPFNLDLVELPRLKMSFHSKVDHEGVLRLFSMDHVNLFVTNERSQLTADLIRGIPHSLLLSDSNHEISILVPSIHPVRPFIGSSPFSTELVLDRSDKKWYDALDTKYYLYPVHVSLSFLFTPTLASALYLLQLRFLHRQYNEAVRLATAIATDTHFTKEERKIFKALRESLRDCHPNAHAARLKISLVTIDSPVVVPWDLTLQMSRYVTKLPHVSVTCHIEHDEELQLLEHCILSTDDPRFNEEVHTPYDITLTLNRTLYLRALLAGEKTAVCSVVPRLKDSGWPYKMDMTALSAMPENWRALSLNYAPPMALSGQMLLNTIHQFWSGQENLAGNRLGMGFLFLYNLFTGSIKCKVGANDDSHSVATILSQLLADKKEYTILGSLLDIMAKNPELCKKLPKYVDKRKLKNNLVNGWGDDTEPVSPIDDLFSVLIPTIVSEADSLYLPPDSHPTLPEPKTFVNVVAEGERDWIIPVLSDFMCEQRELRPVEKTGDSISIDEEILTSFSTFPLRPIGLDTYIGYLSRLELKREPVTEQLPFDVSQHSQAHSEVAISMIQRLQAVYADLVNYGRTPKFTPVLDDQASAFVNHTDPESLDKAINDVQKLLELLNNIRVQDKDYVNKSIPYAVEQANAVPSIDKATTESHRYVLKRFCGMETFIWLDYLIGSLLSSKSEYDLQKLNPYFSNEKIQHVYDVLVGTILHSNRAGQINRAMSDARDLLGLLQIAKAKTSQKGDPATLAGLIQKGESLAVNLATKRHYIDTNSENKRVYDPRFLVFEFTWNIILRESQVKLVREFMDALKNNRSLVKQMIMGAGKTTTVGPLLALMLGDGKSLVVQVVPPALLEFSRSVMRSTFSSIMHKRIYTLTSDRAAKVDQSMFKKLSNAVRTRGVVISTPTSIKSVQLKFLEMLHMLEDESMPHHPQMERDAAELGRVLSLFRDSVLIMDEVDLILHPLKSELNFPIGTKLDLDFHPLRWKLPIHLIDAVFYAERDRMAVGFRESHRAIATLAKLKEVIQEGYKRKVLQRNPHIVLLDPDFYHEYMKPIMAEWTLLWIESQNVSGVSPTQVLEYILAESADAISSSLADTVNSLAPKHRKMLNLSRDWLRMYLPHILQKIDRVTFGILNKADYDRAIAEDPNMPRTRAKLGVPFVGKDVPSRSSEFAHPDIIIGLTVLAYRYEGLRWTDFNDIVANLRSTLTKEIGPWNERKSSLRYAGWVKEAGGKVRIARNYLDEPEGNNKGKTKVDDAMEVDDEKTEVVPLRLLKRSNEDQMNKLFKLLYKLPDVIHWYLNEFVFPAYMRHQVIKLSSSGQELGGDMLFSRRIGFSGTPSDLLPIELGRCGYEKGSDGKMMAYLTSPEIVSYEVVEEGWSVRGLLERIATADPPYHALIDTGALITGMSNFEVAQYLLAHGLYGFEGVVFLDENDQKMILVRATNRVMKLAQCGISDKRRFAFYDQVHTTGMDIKHVLNARAVLTLGKDMTFRDYSQGAFRMRGIGVGQTIHLYIIPEVERLMARELKEANMPDYGYTGTKKVLVDVAAWQVINSMRMERIQFNQLCLQNVANVYRKNAYKDLLKNHDSFKVDTKLEDTHLRRCLQVFREPIDFSVEASVPKKREFEETIKGKIESYKHLIYGEEDMNIVTKVLEQVAKKRAKEEKAPDTPDSTKKSEGEKTDSNRPMKRRRLATSLGHFFDAEQVQEQEQEREQQQEQEQEQEIEIEKYVDLAYSREQEEPTPWEFATLRGTDTPQFYNLNDFHLYKRQPLKFEKYLKVSNNYFDKRWSGARRIKNVAMVLEWTPSFRLTTPFPPRSLDMPAKMEAALKKAFQHFDMDQSGDLNATELQHLVRATVDFKPTDQQINDILAEFGSAANNKSALDYDGVKKFLQSGKFREEQDGRYFVVLSLAEAETIRRIMHIRLERDIIDGSPVSMALRCVPAENSLIDVSHNFTPAPHYMAEVAHQSLRFLDCDMHYKDPQLNILLRALQNSTARERVLFFQHVIGCRRRMNRKWEETPIAKVFGLPDEIHLLKQRAQAACMRTGILTAGLPFYDAFRMFDSSNIGLLSAANLWGAMDWLKIEMSAEDVLDFMRTVDTKGDGYIDYRGFLDIVRDPDAKLVDLEDEIESEQSGTQNVNNKVIQVKFQKVEPKGEDLLQELRVRLQQEQKKLDEIEMEQERVYEQKIRRELTEEEEEADRNQIGGPNPSIVRDTVTKFDFTTGRWPRGMTTRGDMAYKSEFDKKYLKLYRLGLMFLPLPLSLPGQRYNQYTVTMEVMFDELPPKKAALFQTAQFNEDLAEAYVLPDGSIGIDVTQPENKSSSNTAKIVPTEWSVIVITVDCQAGLMSTYVNGKLSRTIVHEEIGMPNGRYSVGQQVCLFGSKSTDETFGANIKTMWFEPRALTDTEILLLNEDIQDEGSWECPNCTLRNPRNAIECNSCGHFNIQTESMNTDNWACSVCTFNNQGGDICSVCGSPKMG